MAHHTTTLDSIAPAPAPGDQALSTFDLALFTAYEVEEALHNLMARRTFATSASTSKDASTSFAQSGNLVTSARAFLSHLSFP